MEPPKQSTSSRRPFTDFFLLHAQDGFSVGGYSEQFQSTREVDRPAVEENLNEILEQVCHGDPRLLDDLRDRAGGPLLLNGIYLSAGKDPKLVVPLVEISDIAFDGDTGAMNKLAKKLGGMASLIAVCDAMGGPQALGAVVRKLPPVQLLKCSAEQLLHGDPVLDYHENLVVTFCTTPSAVNAKPLVDAGLLDAGQVLKIVPVDGKRPGTAFFSVSGHAKLVQLCRVESSFKPAESGPTVTLLSVTLWCDSTRIDLKLDTDVQKALCSPFLLWIALSEQHEAEAGLAARSLKRRQRVEQINFDQLDKISVKLVGRPAAYQTKGDLADSAPLKDRNLCCFSFSSELGGDLAGVWVLHAHCQETEVDDEGFCTAFDILAASFKLASQDREVESPMTMKVAAEEVSKAQGSKAEGAEAQALAKFLAQREVVLNLAHSCNPASVLHAWNPEKQRLRIKAPRDTVYDRHNIASPEYDLDGWATTLTVHRIRFLFMTKKGLPGHLGQLRSELVRMTEFAWKADPQTRARFEKVVEKLKAALLQSAKVAAQNAPMGKKEWEDFPFEIDIDFGPFGRLTIKRSASGAVTGSKSPGADQPEAMVQRLIRFANVDLFVSEEAFGDSMTLLQQDATAIADHHAELGRVEYERAREEKSKEAADRAKQAAELRLEILVLCVDELFAAIVKAAGADTVTFAIPSTTLTFKGIKSLTLERKAGGKLVHSTKLLSK